MKSAQPMLVLTVLSLVMGSFLGVIVQRLPSGKSIVHGRSACPNCHRPIGAFDLVPLFSWLALKGRCRGCSGPISLFYPGIELASLIIGLWAASVTSGTTAVAASCLLGWTLLTLTVIDWRHQRLPDPLTFVLGIGGMAMTAVMAPHDLGDHLMGVFAGFAVLAGISSLYRRVRRRDGLGRGDPKMLAGIGAWVSWQGLPSVLVIAALSGLGFVLLRSATGRPVASLEKLPFGPFLAAGGWMVWLYGPLVIS